MKSPNISRLSGGADTKLKINVKHLIKAARVIAACALGIALCFGLYYLFDYVWNGSFLDWFDKYFMVTHNPDYSGQGTKIIVREPAWYKVKVLLLTVLCVNIVAWLLIVFTASFVSSKARMKKTITAASGMVHRYMSGETEAAEVFPKEYAELSAELAEVKSTMQRHEQIMKEETARKNDLIAYLAHDLKTPLTSVIGYLSLMDEAPDMPAAQKTKYMKITLDKALRLEKLINEFFDITRYNLQQIDLEKEQIDLYYMLVQMTDEFYPLLQDHGNEVVLESAEDLKLWGDPAKLARVFNNILKNAIAYSEPDTAIVVRAESAGQDIGISFSNAGKTIPEQKLNAIFDKFFRLDEARATNTGGAGLGLAIAKEIVTLHGGTITAESREGITTFQVTLPAGQVQ